MFLKKKEISEKFIEKFDEEIKDAPSNSPKKDRTKNISKDNARNNFIFFGNDNSFEPEIEIYFTLKNIQMKFKIQKDLLQ